MPNSCPLGLGERQPGLGEVRAPNSAHSLLASGSDDQHTIVWDPLHHKKLLSMHTGHTANIFSVKVRKMSHTVGLGCGHGCTGAACPTCMFLWCEHGLVEPEPCLVYVLLKPLNDSRDPFIFIKFVYIC